jgi:methylthioribose-1-phosphate isomerase
MEPKSIETIRWIGGVDGRLELTDQTLLPTEFVTIECGDVEKVWEAIKMLRVRGAPAIGIAAAYGVTLGLQTVADSNEESFFQRLDEVTEYLAGSRPTAVNLFWALDRLKRKAATLRGRNSPQEITEALLHEAVSIHDEDRQICRDIGRHGAELLADGQGVLTHCNAGGLATADYGTALAVFFSAFESEARYP